MRFQVYVCTCIIYERLIAFPIVSISEIILYLYGKLDLNRFWKCKKVYLQNLCHFSQVSFT